jgi:predicted amidohydrolase YtcJ
VTGRNWHESQLREGRLPTRAELDALDLPGPVLLRRGSHLAVPDSQAAQLLGTGTAPVESDDLIARALDLAGRPSLADRRRDLAMVMARFSARGITSIREAGVDGAELGLFQALRDRDELSLRSDLLWRIPEGSDLDSARQRIAQMPAGGSMDDPFLRLTGVKAFADGRISDAAIDGARDALRVTPAELRAIVGESLRRSPGFGCHAVGDVAVRMVLDVYEWALSAGLARDPRQLVIEHALDCDPETIQRLAAAGVGVSAHPSIVYEFADDIRRHWGERRSSRAAPVRDLVLAGAQVAAGSDGDVPPFDPLRGVWFMVTRMARSGGPIGQGQALTRDVALDLYTRRGGVLLGVEARRGELRPGMDADLAVFSDDPLTCPVDELPEIDVLLTLLAGRAVHDPGRLTSAAGA